MQRFLVHPVALVRLGAFALLLLLGYGTLCTLAWAMLHAARREAQQAGVPLHRDDLFRHDDQSEAISCLRAAAVLLETPPVPADAATTTGSVSATLGARPWRDQLRDESQRRALAAVLRQAHAVQAHQWLMRAAALPPCRIGHVPAARAYVEPLRLRDPEAPQDMSPYAMLRNLAREEMYRAVLLGEEGQERRAADLQGMEYLSECALELDSSDGFLVSQSIYRMALIAVQALVQEGHVDAAVRAQVRAMSDRYQVVPQVVRTLDMDRLCDAPLGITGAYPPGCWWYPLRTADLAAYETANLAARAAVLHGALELSTPTLRGWAPTARLRAPFLSETLRLAEATARYLRLAVLAMAIDDYRSTRGSFPATLSELDLPSAATPDVAPGVSYRRTADGWFLEDEREPMATRKGLLWCWWAGTPPPGVDPAPAPHRSRAP